MTIMKCILQLSCLNILKLSPIYAPNFIRRANYFKYTTSTYYDVAATMKL